MLDLFSISYSIFIILCIKKKTIRNWDYFHLYFIWKNLIPIGFKQTVSIYFSIRTTQTIQNHTRKTQIKHRKKKTKFSAVKQKTFPKITDTTFRTFVSRVYIFSLHISSKHQSAAVCTFIRYGVFDLGNKLNVSYSNTARLPKLLSRVS